MKKIIFTAFAMISFASVYSQACPANDSTIMGPSSGNDVYYSLKQRRLGQTGVVSSVANNNWHLAISVQPSMFPSNPANGVAIRVNSTLGENSQAGTTGTRLVRLSNNISDWRNLDTNGLYALPELIDSDSTWNLSAFTKGYPSGNPFNFIWGTYNDNNHNVESNGIAYVLYNKSAGWYKKIHVQKLTWDTMWHIVLANIDNSDSVYLQINKKDYPKRNFIYYNVLSNQLLDREPDNDQWDLVWTKYKAMVEFMGTKMPYSVTGVLHNRGVKVAKNLGRKCDEVWLINRTAPFLDRISGIGSDWKTFTGMGYSVTDTFVYFIQARDTHTYKMTMKSFAGGAKAKTEFNVYESTLSVDAEQALNTLKIYPNPASGQVRVETEAKLRSVQIMDMQGKTLLSTSEALIDVAGLSSGVYLMLIQTENGSVQHKLIKE